jgi:hypothetical protein
MAIEPQVIEDRPVCAMAPHERVVWVGASRDLVRLLAEYGLDDSDVEGLIRTRTPIGVGGAAGPLEYGVHESVLRSHGEFLCAGDAEALSFCRRIADEMVARFGIAATEASARINRHWSGVAATGPRVWIVGRAIAYHETAEYWAHLIYYGPDSQWWKPGTTPTPRPPP